VLQARVVSSLDPGKLVVNPFYFAPQTTQNKFPVFWFSFRRYKIKCHVSEKYNANEKIAFLAFLYLENGGVKQSWHFFC
jgi:hypothetical protein